MSAQDIPNDSVSSPSDDPKEPSNGVAEPQVEQVATRPTSSGDPTSPKEPSPSEGTEAEEEDQEDEEEGEVSPSDPPLPKGPAPGGPPLPSEPAPQPEDDGWDCQWDATTQAWFFHNRFTGQSQWDNPRVPDAATSNSAAAAAATQPSEPQPPTAEQPAAGGYNPAIHGDYDPNAWYAQGHKEEAQTSVDTGAEAADPYGTMAQFNRFSGQFQDESMGPGRHSDEAKSRRQMNAFFDVDAAANTHDGRSLKAERSNKKPNKTELKAFKEKRRARKEEKRRAWLRD